MKKTCSVIFGIIFVFLIIPYTNSAMSENNVEELLKKAVDSFEDIENWEESMKYFDQVLLLEPNNLDALNGKGAILLRNGHLDESQLYFDKVLEVNPNHIRALNNKGTLAGYLHDFESAKNIFDKILQIEPNNISALLNKASTVTLEENFSEALDLLNKVLSNEPSNKKATELKRDLYNNFNKTRTDGYVQTIIRDKNGNLIGYLESDFITKADYSDVDKLIRILADEFEPEIIYRDNERYTLQFLHTNVSVYNPDATGMQTGTGITWQDESQSEVIDFDIILGRFHGALIDDFDQFSVYWQLVLKE